MKTATIIGMGTVGTALYNAIMHTKNFRIKTWDKQNSDFSQLMPSDFLHIVFPYSDSFIDDVLFFQKKCKPNLIIIHSTVKPGTTQKLDLEKCPVAYSPILGSHDKLNFAIPAFIKMVAAPRKKILGYAIEHLGILGFQLKLMKSTEALELGKLLSTLYFGWCIAFQKEAREICKGQDIYDMAYDTFSHIYNENYRLLLGINESDYYPIRPILNDMPGPIGGKCIIPNAKLLEEFCPNELSEFLLRMNEKWAKTPKKKD